MDPGSQSAFEMVRALRSIKKVFLTENGALPTKAYREDGDETLDPGSKAYREDDKDKNGYHNSLTTV